MTINYRINKMLFIIAFFLFTGVVFSQNIEKENSKNEALEFSLSIIKTYFTNDCESLVKKFAPKIYSIIDEEIMVIDEELKEEICDSLEDAVDDEEKTYDNYLVDYKPRIFTKEEYEKEFELKEPDGFEIRSSDFFFMGNEAADNSEEDYIWDELEVLLIRKVEGKWLIIGGQ